MPHIDSVKFNQRWNILFRQKLVFVTQFCDDAKRFKQVIKIHRKLIKLTVHLAILSQTPPAYRKHKLVRAKLKSIDETRLMIQKPHNWIKLHQKQHKNYVYLWTTNIPNLRAVYKTLNPIRHCCHACVICPLIETRCFTESTTLKQKYPIMLKYSKQFFNCKTKKCYIPYHMHNTWL